MQVTTLGTKNTAIADVEDITVFAAGSKGTMQTIDKLARMHLCGGGSLLLTTTSLAGSLFFLAALFVLVFTIVLVLAGWDPETALTVLHWLVLAGEVDTLATETRLAALRKSSCADRERALDR